jgi:hypothetical protein
MLFFRERSTAENSTQSLETPHSPPQPRQGSITAAGHLSVKAGDPELRGRGSPQDPEKEASK